jgi:hypothetical protein
MQNNLLGDGVTPEMIALITKRLRPICPNIPQEEFDRLVLDVAHFKVKYDDDDGRADGAPDHSGSDDRARSA